MPLTASSHSMKAGASRSRPGGGARSGRLPLSVLDDHPVPLGAARTWVRLIQWIGSCCHVGVSERQVRWRNHPMTCPELPPLRWFGPADNPWGVPVLDVRPVTLEMI